MLIQNTTVQTTAAGGVSWEVVEEQAASSAPKDKKKKKQMKVKVPKWCGKWVVGMDNFKEGVVGAKSKNIAGDHPCQVLPLPTHGSIPEHSRTGRFEVPCGYAMYA